ncbi:hypothetical protein P7H60_11320 [Vagococcus carniphilus]|uniref:hypothetical protein n=1 Tax=Vagococcus carniphilus TaxID=218144 RepID=UPI00288DAB36|nr:hypothetical protein [Vagococcus carniphilus]MDT2849731.1 hypothetical protein [Vagococcus carniphilus]
MKESLKNKLKQLETQIVIASFNEVIFQINGQNEDGEELETMISVNGEVMTIDIFNEKYPNFKPNGISVVLGDWED